MVNPEQRNGNYDQKVRYLYKTVAESGTISHSQIPYDYERRSAPSKGMAIMTNKSDICTRRLVNHDKVTATIFTVVDDGQPRAKEWQL